MYIIYSNVFDYIFKNMQKYIGVTELGKVLRLGFYRILLTDSPHVHNCYASICYFNLLIFLQFDIFHYFDNRFVNFEQILKE